MDIFQEKTIDELLSTDVYENQKRQILDDFLSDDMKKLNKICKFLVTKKGAPNMHEDDLYSLGRLTFLESLVTYDPSKECKFQTYLEGNIWRAFYDWTRDSTRWKRCNLQTDNKGKLTRDEDNNPIIISDIPIDALTEDGIDLSERIASDFNIENELSEESVISSEENVQNYLSSLNETEKQIAALIIQGYEHSDIKEKLGFSEKRYSRLLKNMSSFEKQIIINYNKSNVQIEEDKEMEYCTQTLEKSKPDRWSVASIIKKINNYTIRFDHPLQRESEQWSSVMKGNLISDILQDNPIPPLVFAEQVINGLATVWNLDGKQRSTNVYSYKNDGFKITKNVRRWNIHYQAIVKDKQGRPILDENGFRQCEQRCFDIRGKKFSDLPEELKDNFLDYNFEIVHYLNCKSDDIAYHLARYNEGKSMSASQKGIIRIGEEFATMVKSISAMPFFKEKAAYTGAEYSNGTVDRVVIESVMASNFLNEWRKDQNDMCSYMRENATSEMFENFEDVIDRLSKVGTDEVFEMFNSKDSFLYFGLFARFVNTGLDDEKFVEFIAEFSALHSKEVNGVTFDDLNGKSTKDKNVVISKIKHLEVLMNEFLHITKSEVINEEDKTNEEIQVIDFVRENAKPDVTEDDIDDYYGMLDGYRIDKHSKLLSWENEPSLIALIAYSFDNDIDLDNWIVKYFNSNSNFIADQKENYLHMKQSLEKYIEKGEAA